jgi:LmbE family N-acetylglucosaminyl deacetylase
MRIDFPWCKASYPVDIETLAIPDDIKVWVCAPHPDDFDAVAVTLKKFHDSGADIFLTVATGSPAGVEDSFCTPPSDENKIKVREAEQLESCRTFGLKTEQVKFLRMLEDSNGCVTSCPGNAALLEQILLQFEPDVIVLPHGNDTNSDHRVIFGFINNLLNNIKRSCLLMLNRDAKTIQMQEQVFTCFDEAEAAWKAQLLRCHKSQHQRNLNTRGYGFDERVLRLNRSIAESSGMNCPYAESFELRKF